jgi:hypothetical protein
MRIKKLIKAAPLIGAFFMSGCSVYGGMAMHHERWDAPEINLPNPIGIIGAEYRADENVVLYCEHLSSIPLQESGYGLNLCGFRYHVKLR